MSELMSGLKEYFATRGKEKLVEKLKGAVIGGLSLYLANDFIPKYIRKAGYTFIRKNLKEHAPLLEKTGVALAVQMVMPEQYEESIISDIVDLMGLGGVADVVAFYVDKKAECILIDANTIECKNFDDLANAIVIIDGTQLTSGTDYTVSGEQIQLTNALASGDHTIIVIDGTKKKVAVEEAKV